MPTRIAGRPRTKPAEARRDDLMTSALRVFMEKGVGSATIDEIAKGADLSKGAFYLYFSSKEDVLESLRVRFVEQLLHGITAAIEKLKKDDWHSKLRIWSQSCAAGYLNGAGVHHLVFASALSPSREGMTKNILIDDLAKLLAGGNREGAWSVDDPNFTAVFLFNALHGVVNQQDVAQTIAARRKLLSNIDGHFSRTVNQTI